jgi:hypothetical protein
MSVYRSIPFSFKACLIGAAAAGSMALMPAPQAKAACLPNDALCTSFDPASPSNVSNRSGFTGSFDPEDPFLYSQIRVGFLVSGMGANPNLTLSNISLTGNGITSSLNLGNYTINSNSFATNSTSWFDLDTPVGAYNFVNSTISFTIPGGQVPAGAVLQARLQVRDEDDTQLNTSTGNFSTTAIDSPPDPPESVPGPVPVVGACVAFAMSRRLRRRIAHSA